MEAILLQRDLFIPESLYRDPGEVEVVRRKRELVIRPKEKNTSAALVSFDETYQRDRAFMAEVAAAEPPFSWVRNRSD